MALSSVLAGVGVGMQALGMGAGAAKGASDARALKRSINRSIRVEEAEKRNDENKDYLVADPIYRGQLEKAAEVYDEMSRQDRGVADVMGSSDAAVAAAKEGRARAYAGLVSQVGQQAEAQRTQDVQRHEQNVLNLENQKNGILANQAVAAVQAGAGVAQAATDFIGQLEMEKLIAGRGAMNNPYQTPANGGVQAASQGLAGASAPGVHEYYNDGTSGWV